MRTHSVTIGEAIGLGLLLTVLTTLGLLILSLIVYALAQLSPTTLRYFLGGSAMFLAVWGVYGTFIYHGKIR